MSGFDESLLPENYAICTDNPWHPQENKNNVLILLEPEVIGHLRGPTIQNIDKFHTVYTCDEEILARFPEKARRYLGCSGSWAKDASLASSPKEFKFSSVTGTKCFPGVPGHALRHQLYFNQAAFPNNFVFFRSGAGEPLQEIGINPILPYKEEGGWGSGKEHLFDGFQFSIVIENTQQKNFFTEKILDCLIFKTIPIYWGCPNIGEFFDTTGWIFFQSGQDLLKQIASLDAGYYERHSDTVNKNHEEALKYQNFYDSFNRQAREYQS
jgi:hypothetical protein